MFQKEFQINGIGYTATVGLAATMKMHELTVTRPEMFEALPDNPNIMRIPMTPEHAPVFFAMFTGVPEAHWVKALEEAHPLAVIQAWGVIDALMQDAYEEWESDQDNPFRTEQEEPVDAAE